MAVYGGVPCGIAAAIAAAREGAKVLLIEPTKHIGGLSTSGINTAESEHMLHWTIGGVALEFYRRLGDHYGTGKPEFYFESSVAEKVYLAMLREAGVTVRYGQRVEKVDKRAARIHSITLTDASTVLAKVFIDASYEGDLMTRAGVPSTFGRESRTEFNEEAAGVRFDRIPSKAATIDSTGKLLPRYLRLGPRSQGRRRPPRRHELQLPPDLCERPRTPGPHPAPAALRPASLYAAQELADQPDSRWPVRKAYRTPGLLPTPQRQVRGQQQTGGRHLPRPLRRPVRLPRWQRTVGARRS